MDGPVSGQGFSVHYAEEGGFAAASITVLSTNRAHLTEFGLQYAVGIESSTTVWEPGQRPLPAPPKTPGRGAEPKRLRRTADHWRVPVKQLVLGLPLADWTQIGWRQGSRQRLHSRFAAVRVRPAHRDEKRTEPHPDEWLLIEWPQNETEPSKYWLSTLPAKTSLRSLVKDGQTPLDHRTRLRGTETGTWIRPL